MTHLILRKNITTGLNQIKQGLFDVNGDEMDVGWPAADLECEPSLYSHAPG